MSVWFTYEWSLLQQTTCSFLVLNLNCVCEKLVSYAGALAITSSPYPAAGSFPAARTHDSFAEAQLWICENLFSPPPRTTVLSRGPLVIDATATAQHTGAQDTQQHRARG